VEFEILEGTGRSILAIESAWGGGSEEIDLGFTKNEI